jgi:eukaryotic-like serine/threonine-protein kinase
LGISDWRRVEEIVHEALERSPGERLAFVRDASGGDEALRRDVESLLANASIADKSTLRIGNLGLDLVGQQIGVYRVDSMIGAGGMGEVYRARDTKLQRDVAIKALPVVFTSDGDRRARFEREARVLASLNHPHIGAIYGLEESQGASFLVLELVEGLTLAERIAKGPLSLSESLDVARQIADALDVAHEKGIVHRDLKPANIKITPEGVVKVLDFGLAKVFAGDATAPDLTQSPTVTVGGTRGGAILGTAAYMSPEQARGQPVDKRTDIWAFGCVLYEMLTGRLAFPGHTVSDVIAAILEREPDWSMLPDSTPPTIRKLLTRCFEKNTRTRLRDIGDARLEVEDALNRTDVTTAGPDARRPRELRLAWTLTVMVAAAAGAFAIGSGAFSGASSVGVPTFSRVVRLTSSAAREMAPAISPDGKWVAYLSDARGTTDVWVQFVAGGPPINLTKDANIVLSSRSIVGGLEISLDGSRILFAGGPKDTAANFTYSVPAPLGGAPSLFLGNGKMGARWSPDGRRIAYVLAGSSAGDAIWIADGDGSNERLLVQAEGNLHKHWPSWSADGKYIYFNHSITAWNAAPTEVYRVAATGGPPELVVASASRAAFAAATPDGRALIYAADPVGAELSLWWRPLAGGRSVRLTTGVGEYAQPRISLNGQTMVCTLFERRDSLVRIDLGSNLGSTAGSTPLMDGYTGDLDPNLSRSDRLVFSSTRSGQRNLWIARSDSTDPRPLAPGDSIDEYPQFSPDGQQVAFISNRGGERGLWIVSVDGGVPRRLLVAAVLPYFSWSPDGREIVYSTPAGELPGLSVINVSDGRTRRLPTPSGATSPAWSPTADLITYLEVLPNSPGQQPIAYVRFMTSSGQPVPLDIGQTLHFVNGFLAWSRDGRKLAATRVPGTAAASVWVSDLDASRPIHQVLKVPDDALIRGIAWSGDGRSVIIGQQRASSDIVLFERTPGSP